MEKTFRILIIEDNDRNQRLLRLILDHLGYESILACDGAEGIEKALLEKPDLIITDIQMPKLDGIATLAVLQADLLTKEIPVIAVTSFAMPGDRERLLSKGFVEYIAKPIDTDEFTKTVQDVLRKKYGRA